MAEKIVQIRSGPGIKRDGTKFEGDSYVDGQWVRWQRGLPRKMGGYRSISKYLREVSRALHEYTQDNLTYVHSGSANFVERFYIDGSFNTSVITNRTPAALDLNDANMWQFDVDTAAGLGGAQLVAQVAPNLNCICNTTGGELYSGDLTGAAALTAITLPNDASVTGGIVALHPYLLFFGDDGYVGWSVAGNPTDLIGAGSGAANVTGKKIVRGLPMRGGGSGPAGLLWSVDALVRANFVGGSAVWAFDEVTSGTSVLSPSSIIEYDGVYYWCGVDRFLMFNGVVRDVDNQMNTNYFFDNLNYSQRMKVFAFKVPRFGEIWWCYPSGESTEPDRAVIYNVRENCWYDTALPNGGRGAGIFPTVFRRPLLTGVVDNGIGYKLWVHEIGTDEVDGADTNPIPSYFETADISLPIQAGDNRSLQAITIEPDFVQAGDMTVQVKGRANARAPEIDGEIMTFPDTATSVSEQIVNFKEGRRQLRFRFESNCVGGNYEMGHVLAHVRPADGRTTG